MTSLNTDIIHNEERAYVLGWLAIVGDKAPDALKHHDSEWVKEVVGDYTNLQQVSERLALHEMPAWVMQDRALGWAFVRGYFDHHGQISNTDAVPPMCKLYGPVEMLTSITDFVSIPSIPLFHGPGGAKRLRPMLLYKGTNAIDMLGKLYDNAHVFWAKRRSQYLDLLSAGPRRVPHVYYSKTLPNAVVPSKAHPSDVGYDLTIVAEYKKVNSVTTMYDTGIRVRTEHGWYAEVVPRSSIVKSGYMLTNGQGIIDPSYQGSILVALTKVDPDAEPIQLPFRGFQVILRRQHHGMWVEGAETDTARKEGGFGSSN
jgi:deoxyuridine 5'-triphosphate nucleotidohydrolase